MSYSSEQLKQIDRIEPDIARQVPGELLDYKLLCRQNTGRSLYDSGDAYGRHWEAPPPEDRPVIWDDPGMGGFITTHLALREVWPLNKHLTASYWLKFERIGKLLDSWRSEEATDLDIVHAFLRARGYVADDDWNDTAGSDRLDLSQPVAFRPYLAPEGLDDLMVVRTHNGCDIRGGWSTPVIANDMGSLDTLRLGYRVYRTIGGADVAETWSDPGAMRTDVEFIRPASIDRVAFPAIRKRDGAMVFITCAAEDPADAYRETEDAIHEAWLSGNRSHKRDRWMSEVERRLWESEEPWARELRYDLQLLRNKQEDPR